jgi:hypothetical protein
MTRELSDDAIDRVLEVLERVAERLAREGEDAKVGAP